MIRVKRQCDFEPAGHGPHVWEWLNPVTWEPFRRGRVVFFCRGRRWTRDR